MIPGLAVFQGTKHQYPLYDALAMGVMMMVFTYILGRTDPEGRNVIETWAAAKSSSRTTATVLSIIGVVVLANLMYGAVFAPHLTAKLEGWETAGPRPRCFMASRISLRKAPLTPTGARPQPHGTIVDRRSRWCPRSEAPSKLSSERILRR